MRQSERIRGFTGAIWSWYALHKRRLPWRDLAVRDDSERAYRILVSEVMLQQTQVERVKTIFVSFLEQFPMLNDLASASNKQVILAWRGMGYNSRALRLRDAAHTIVEQHDGIFPKDLASLVAIKGIGAYTAAAILNFAFNTPIPCIDTNIRRILHRTFVGPENSDGTWRKDDRDLLKLAGEVLKVALGTPPIPQPLPLKATSIPQPFPPPAFAKATTSGEEEGGSFERSMTATNINIPPLLGRGGKGERKFCEEGDRDGGRDARNWHAALMDFGSIVQTKKNPKWEECPLTARKIMKTTRSSFERSNQKSAIRNQQSREPGRTISGRFTPNRIIRGRIIEALRDEAAGLSPAEIGKRVCSDWSERLHRKWLREILAKLERETIIAARSRKYVLAE